MTEAPINKGVLTDKEGHGFPGCRIGIDGERADRPFVVLSFVQKYLDGIPKHARVGFQTKDGKISKIFEDKEPATVVAPNEVMTDAEVDALKARGEAAHAEKQEAAKDKPLESGIKIVQGQIAAIDFGIHIIEVKDKEGKHHQMMWSAPLNERMTKLKQWFFVTISAEKAGEYWKVIDQTYFARPADWPVSQKQGGGGKPFTPRNEKIIVMQSSLKVCADLFQYCNTPDTQDYEAACELVYETALAMTEKIMKDTVMK